jgi:hypothetical protein
VIEPGTLSGASFHRAVATPTRPSAGKEREILCRRQLREMKIMSEDAMVRSSAPDQDVVSPH